ncbi:hypothetical protein FQZ97_962150 [compost metagenome]
MQHAAGIQQFGRRGHFGRHLQAQQGIGRHRGWGPSVQALEPRAAGCRVDPRTQRLRRRQLRRIALLPSGQQLGQDLAVRLRRELAQRRFGVFDRLTLGTESGIPQARTPRLAVKPFAAAPVADISPVTTAAKTTPCIAAVAARRTPAVITSGGFGLFHARPVIATHRHDLLGWGGGLDGCRGRGDFAFCIGRR